MHDAVTDKFQDLLRAEVGEVNYERIVYMIHEFEEELELPALVNLFVKDADDLMAKAMEAVCPTDATYCAALDAAWKAFLGQCKLPVPSDPAFPVYQRALEAAAEEFNTVRAGAAWSVFAARCIAPDYEDQTGLKSLVFKGKRYTLSSLQAFGKRP
jgi:hypothetical protein